MTEKKLEIIYKEYASVSELSKSDKELVEVCIAFAQHAYAPYSHFNVSACLRLNDGQILKGANVENASYPVGICAERTLVSHAVTNFPKSTIEVIAIYVDKDLSQPVPPCGLCRQTLAEVESRQNKDIRLLLISKKGQIIELKSCLNLLPLSFSSKFLD